MCIYGEAMVKGSCSEPTNRAMLSTACRIAVVRVTLMRKRGEMATVVGVADALHAMRPAEICWEIWRRVLATACCLAACLVNLTNCKSRMHV